MLSRQVISATVEDGVLKPDQPLEFPQGTKVHVVIEPFRSPQERQHALQELEKLRKEHPINSGGNRMTRDQLHERR
jgi:predicted DNA-binding antitoxin AbrB/MazE fold protein